MWDLPASNFLDFTPAFTWGSSFSSGEIHFQFWFSSGGKNVSRTWGDSVAPRIDFPSHSTRLPLPEEWISTNLLVAFYYNNGWCPQKCPHCSSLDLGVRGEGGKRCAGQLLAMERLGRVAPVNQRLTLRLKHIREKFGMIILYLVWGWRTKETLICVYFARRE